MHTFAHIELPALNLAREAEFYTALFGWKFFANFGDGYLLFGNSDEEIVGGLSQVAEIPHIEGFHNYVEVVDIEAALAKAGRIGGQTTTPRTELPGGFGAYAVIRTPDGYSIGIWQRAS